MTSSDSEEQISPEAVAVFYREHGDDLFAFLAGVLRDRELAGEVLQTVFRKALERGHTIQQDSRGWLFRVAYNEAMLVRRVQTRERGLLKKAAWHRKVTDSVVDFSDSAALRSETVKQVRLAIEELPETQRDVVRKRMYEEKTFAVIADELQLPLGTVLTRMRLATERLRKALRRHIE